MKTSNATGISWADVTWNPITGCHKVSPGCANCYAETITLRFKRGGPFMKGQGAVKLHSNRLHEPRRWRKPRLVFVCSMSDIGHEDVPAAFLDYIFATMAQTPKNYYLLLTKREGLFHYLNDPGVQDRLSAEIYRRGYDPVSTWLRTSWPLPNVGIGISAENQTMFDRRIAWLNSIEANMKFVSFEPLLREIDVAEPCVCGHRQSNHLSQPGHDRGKCSLCALPDQGWCSEYAPRSKSFDWAIIGGESGHGARPMHPAWVKRIMHHCNEYNGAAVHFKQWGAHIPIGEVSDDWDIAPTTFLDRSGKKYPFPFGGPMGDSGQVLVRRKRQKSNGALWNGELIQEFPYQIRDHFQPENSVVTA